jgi:hypothetical protein
MNSSSRSKEVPARRPAMASSRQWLRAVLCLAAIIWEVKMEIPAKELQSLAAARLEFLRAQAKSIGPRESCSLVMPVRSVL